MRPHVCNNLTAASSNLFPSLTRAALSGGSPAKPRGRCTLLMGPEELFAIEKSLAGYCEAGSCYGTILELAMQPRLIGLDREIILRPKLDVPLNRALPCLLRRAGNAPSSREHVGQREPRFSATGARGPRPRACGA